MNRMLEVKKYVIPYITAVSVFWLLYWIIPWGLYGLARLSESRPLMNWLGSEYRNNFEPAKDYLDLIDSLDIARGVEYLNGNSVWAKDGMESIQCLQGLYDELNHYDLDEMQERDFRIRTSGYMSEIIDILVELKRLPHSKEYEIYNSESDNKITPENYVSRIKEKRDSLVHTDIGRGVEYLNENDVWVRDEMDSIQCLQGLFDELKCYDLNKLRKRDVDIQRSRYMREIINLLKKNFPRSNIFDDNDNKKNYREERDNTITPEIYIRRIKNWQHNECKSL